MRKISSKLSTRENPDLPPEISQFINGRSLRLADPERYFAKHWRFLLPSLVQGVSEVRPNVFKLEPEAFERFMSILRSSLVQKNDSSHAEFRASDWIARALAIACSADGSFVPVQPRFVDDQWRVVKLPHEGSEDEKVLRTAQVDSEELDSRSVAMKITLEPTTDDDDCPSMVISLRGHPLWLFEDVWRAGQRISQKRRIHKQAESLWRLLSEAMAAHLGIESARRGRPAQNKGQLAAFAKGHLGLTWQQVAQKLCPEEHTHGSQCRDNYRKQASQYWQRESKRYAALAQAPSTSMDDEQEDTDPSGSDA